VADCIDPHCVRAQAGEQPVELRSFVFAQHRLIELEQDRRREPLRHDCRRDDGCRRGGLRCGELLHDRAPGRIVPLQPHREHHGGRQDGDHHPDHERIRLHGTSCGEHAAGSLNGGLIALLSPP
jgi:hypothetical protein